MPARNHQGPATPQRHASILAAALISVTAALGAVVAATSIQGGAFPGPLPLFPRDNWWNLDISTAPVDPASASYITFVGTDADAASGLRRRRVAGQRADLRLSRTWSSTARSTPRAVQFHYADESDGVEPRDQSERAVLSDSGRGDHAGALDRGRRSGQRRPAQQQRSAPAHRRSRSPAISTSSTTSSTTAASGTPAPARSSI